MLVARKETRTPTTGAQAPSLGRMSRLASLVQSRSESADAPHDGQRQARRPQAADGPGARFTRVRAVWLLSLRLKLGVCHDGRRAPSSCDCGQLESRRPAAQSLAPSGDRPPWRHPRRASLSTPPIELEEPTRRRDSDLSLEVQLEAAPLTSLSLRVGCANGGPLALAIDSTTIYQAQFTGNSQNVAHGRAT